MDAIIKLLESGSPYRPWRVPGDAKPGEGVIAVLDNDPISVVAEVGVIGAGGAAERAIEDLTSRTLLDLGTLASLTPIWIQRDGVNMTLGNAARLSELLGEEGWEQGDLAYLNGHTTLAAARILLRSGGRCTGCERSLDLTRPDARYHLHIDTVDFDPLAPGVPVAYDPPPEEPEIHSADLPYSAESIQIGPGRWRPISVPLDWPAVLCDPCHDRMRLGGFTNFLDFRFSRHPACPSCSARWSLRTTAGFAAEPPHQPWIRHTGCCPDERWQCGACGHRWGGRFEFGSGS